MPLGIGQRGEQMAKRINYDPSAFRLDNCKCKLLKGRGPCRACEDTMCCANCQGRMYGKLEKEQALCTRCGIELSKVTASGTVENLRDAIAGNPEGITSVEAIQIVGAKAVPKMIRDLRCDLGFPVVVEFDASLNCYRYKINDSFPK